MPVIGHGVEVCTSTTRPSSPSLGTIIYQTDTDEYLKYVTDNDSTNRWMQADIKTNRNILINGAMRVWQRGTSINAGGGGASTYAMDRWCFGNNNASSYNMSQVTNVPNNQFLYSGRLTCNSATVYALNGWEQYIEQLNMRHTIGKYITLSFWIRGSKSFSGACYVDCGTTANQNPGNGNGLTGATSLISGTTNMTTSWQKVVITSSVVVPSNAAVMRVGLPKPLFATNDWYEVTGVQLEVGTAPSEFEFKDYGTELSSCKRYYHSIPTQGMGYVAAYPGSSGLRWLVYPYTFPVTMRITPQITNNFANVDNASTGGINADADGLRLYVASANTAYGYMNFNFGYTANAEL